MDNKEEEYFDDMSDFEDTKTSQPQNMDDNTFRQRNDPAPLIQKFRLHLMNAYILEEHRENEDTGETITVKKFKFRKNTTPMANKEGVEGIINYLTTIINNHIVQGHLPTIDEFKDAMKNISKDLLTHFYDKQNDWGISDSNVDVLAVESVNMIYLFLSRTLFNKERESYNEGFKETTSRKVDSDDRPSTFSKIASFLMPGKSKNDRRF